MVAAAALRRATVVDEEVTTQAVLTDLAKKVLTEEGVVLQAERASAGSLDGVPVRSRILRVATAVLESSRLPEGVAIVARGAHTEADAAEGRHGPRAR